jgi:hypothetical protein
MLRELARDTLDLLLLQKTQHGHQKTPLLSPLPPAVFSVICVEKKCCTLDQNITSFILTAASSFIK